MYSTDCFEIIDIVHGTNRHRKNDKASQNHPAAPNCGIIKRGPTILNAQQVYFISSVCAAKWSLCILT